MRKSYRKRGSTYEKRRGLILITSTMLIIIVGSTCFATILFNAFFKETNTINGNEKTSTVSSKNGESQPVFEEFSVVQCGVFGVRENADKAIATIRSIGNPFIVNKDSKFKIFYGIYETGKELDAVNKLKASGITVAKVKTKLPIDNIAYEQISEITKGLIKLTNKLEDASAMSVKTESFKAWSVKLDKVSTDVKGSKELQELKDYVSKLPNTINKSEASDANVYILELLAKVTSS